MTDENYVTVRATKPDQDVVWLTRETFINDNESPYRFTYAHDKEDTAREAMKRNGTYQRKVELFRVVLPCT